MLPRMMNLAAIYYYNYSLLGPSYATEFGGGISGQNNQVIAHTYNQMDTNPGYTARICNAILIRFRERYVGDKIRRRWIPPKLFGVQNVVYRRRVRLQYVSNAPQYPIRPQFVGVIVLNGIYCSSNYLQSVRHTIYIEAIVVIFPVVFILITLMNNRNCMVQTCCRNKTNYVCPQKQRTIGAIENRFLLGTHNGLHVVYYTEDSNFGFK